MTNEQEDRPEMPLEHMQARPAAIRPYIISEEPRYPAAPEGFDGWEESRGLPGTVDFDFPGDYVAGHYRGRQENVGPNKSRMYYLALHPSKEIVGIWGSTALDKRMDMLSPQPSDGLMIQYLGTAETERGQNPVKVFRVRIKRRS